MWLPIAWVACGVLIALTSRVAAERFWILSLVPLLMWAVVGGGLAVYYLWRARRPDRRRMALSRAAVVLIGFALFAPGARLGRWLTESYRFDRERPTYDRIVAGLDTSAAYIGPRSANGVTYLVDPGPPTRVAFIWPGGVIDNWCGVVHDPSGEVIKVNSLDTFSDAWRSSPITAMFGGDMVGCRAMAAPYYLCCFT
jgi:hypothetical protein